ncbi:MAG: tRNA uridine-5-carboxymethylaminomethyl(34) synthesis GTPase MnmE, partial [Clostridia bacterium]|nr:tRNA uridine-5-carboxymethylaminomethyl(34) synthesis GTPase MnmE [Clostridia bacterium]
LEDLKARITQTLSAERVRHDGSVITNRRQAEALSRAAEAAKNAADALAAGFTPDIAWVDAEAALSAIGEVTGQTVNEEILDRVFERFCVGK